MLTCEAGERVRGRKVGEVIDGKVAEEKTQRELYS